MGEVKKHIIAAITALFLLVSITQCSFLPNEFDSVEFNQLAELYVISSKPASQSWWCNPEEVKQMSHLSNVLKVYSQHRFNQNTANIYSEINDLVTELQSRLFPEDRLPSESYCRLKRENIATVSEGALIVFGGRK